MFGSGKGFAATAKSTTVKTSVVSTGLEDQKAVSLTIYNVNLGLVKDHRVIKLTKGTEGKLSHRVKMKF